MRKTSLDAADNTSMTSGIEGETKKPGAGILKTTKNSIKRKVQHFSNERDDMANEPLLHKNKENIEIEKQSAKYLISKTKTDFSSEKGDDKDKLLDDDQVTKPSISEVKLFTGAHTAIQWSGKGSKEQKVNSSQAILPATTNIHTNSNLSNNSVRANNSGITKSQIFVELDASKSMGYSRSPLIFTTAKIHTDGKIQQMEPVQVTPGPILSTIEGGIVKTESKLLEKSNKTGNTVGTNCSFKKDTTVTSPTFQVVSSSTLPEVHDNVTSRQNVSSRSSNEPVISDKTFDSGNKINTETTIKEISLNSNSIKNTVAQLPQTSKPLKDTILSTKISQVIPDNKYKIENNAENSTSAKSLPTFSKDELRSSKSDEVKKSGVSLQTNSTIEKNYVDINKNFQVQSPADNNDTNPISNIANVKPNVAGSSAKEGLEKTNASSITTIKTCGKMDKPSEIKESIESNHNLTTTNQNGSKTKKVIEKEKSDLHSGTNAKESSETSNLISKATSNTSIERKIIVDASNPLPKVKPVDNNMIINSDKSVRGVGIAINKTAIRTTTESSSIPVSISTRSTAQSHKAVKKDTSPVMKASSPTSSSIMTSSAVSSALSTGPKNIKLTPKSTSTTSAEPKLNTTSIKSTYDSSKTKLTSLTTDSTKTKSSDPKATVEKNPKTELESTNLSNTSQTTTTTATTTASKSTLTGNSTSKVLSTAMPKNIATIVSSIPKPTTSAPSMTAPKITNSKQSAFPSVTTASSAVKTSIVSPGPPDKTNSKSASNSVTKSISAVSNKTIPAKLSTAEKSSTTTSSSGTTSTSLTSVAAKTATTGKVEPSETVKDSKGSKA